MWNSGVEANKEIARKQKRRLHYVSNIYVVSDPSNPENEGKVVLFKYGTKIYEKIDAILNPDPAFPDEPSFNIFDFWEGANFKMKIRNVEGYRNYDKSEFESPSPLFDDDEKIDEVWNKCESLYEFIDPKNYKTYEELEKRMNKVLQLDGVSKPAPAESRTSVTGGTKAAPAEKSVSYDDDDDDSDVDVDYFRALSE